MNAGKAARNQSSIINRTNTCGGMKKAGIVSRNGMYLSSNPKLIGGPQTAMYAVCNSHNTVVQTQSYGYRATHTGRMG